MGLKSIDNKPSGQRPKWKEKKIGELCEPNREKANPISLPSGYPCIELEHISQETGRLLGKSMAGDSRSLKARFNVGDVLFGKLRPYLKKYLFPNFDGVCSTEIWVFRASEKILNKYLFYIVQSNDFIRVANLSAGTKMPRAEWKAVSELLITVPPTKVEQEVIANALSDADAYIESLEKLIAKNRLIKKGAMQELLTGKRRLPGFSGEWEILKISELATLSKVSLNPASNPEVHFTHFSLPSFDAGEIPILETGSAIGSNKFFVPQDAVLVSKLNPRIPRIWSPRFIPENSVCSTEFLVLRPKPNTSREFLATVCRSPSVAYQMELHAIGTTGSHQRISPKQVMAIEVNVPTDRIEQSAIEQILSDMEADITVKEEKLAKARLIKQGMMQELLTGRIRLV